LQFLAKAAKNGLPMKSLPKNYDHKEAEPRLQRNWEEAGVYAWDESQPRANTFVIDTPPPTVSGVLHMGHIFSYTQADFVARYQRMSGKTVFYPMGFDDNGLPTERLVEKEKKVRGSAMPREEFVKLCREVVKSAEDEFRTLFKGVALSVDWAQEYQTISDDVRRLSQMSFLDLLKKGEAYRDFRPTYWDWVDQTAIAQAEIENKEMPGVMNEIEFTLEDGTKLVIATTRPELLGACVAVMYHPEDPNAAKYKGKYAVTPVFGVKVPMIADELVERDKGTGLVMCCTFGDDTDKEWWRKYKLPLRALLTQQGKIDFENALFISSFVMPAKAGIQSELDSCFRRNDKIQGLQGLKPKQANAKMIELLQADGKLIKQINITHTVKCAERSGTPIEIIPTSQWFVRVTDKKDALKAKGAECKWYPEFMHLRLNQWIDGLKEDWCISRQRFFGVPFPVWYSKRAGEEGKILFADFDQVPIDPLVDLPKGYTHDEVIGDKDVMDTWATSSVSPQINAGAISKASAEKPSPSGRGLGEGPVAKHLPLSQTFLTHARNLRRNATDAEQYLWSILRGRGVMGFKFRRQHTIEPYIVDFFCYEANLIIELDGGQHNEEPARAKDETRARVLESKGYTVLRFWNNDVLGNIEGVLEVLAQALERVAPHPSPLPEGEGISSAGDRFSKLFPADLRPQAHEIIRTWAFYTIVKAHLHENSVPWHNLMISGWCLAADKSKMSKSKGNVITPVDLIREKSADVVRYWASTSRLGADTAFSEDLLKIGKKLVTKLWNATAFAAIHLGKLSTKPASAAEDVASGRITEALDKWILSRLHKTVAKATLEFARFEYCDARVAVEEFFWKDFCDNYLELVKARAYGEIGDAQAQSSAHTTLYYCLNAILRLFAPFVPHVTEELFSHLFEGQGSVHARGTWLKAEEYPVDEAAEVDGKACVAMLETVRKAKSEKNVSIKFPIEEITVSTATFLNSDSISENGLNMIEPILGDLKSAGNIKSFKWSPAILSNGILTEDKRFRLAITFGEQADVA
jgi:valyl-tRNA synthetase/very-short-patch-repair endonuclease